MILLRISPLFACILFGSGLPSLGGFILPQPTLPTTDITVSYTQFSGVSGTARTTRNGTESQNEAFGQSVLSTALDGDEVSLQTLFLRTSRTGNDVTLPLEGIHELAVWIGEWDDDNDRPGATIREETFDVAGMDFDNDAIYAFHFDTSFDVWDPLAPDQDYAFQVWWTRADIRHGLSWDVDTGQGFVDGAIISDSGAGLTELPFDDKATGSSDIYFAFQSVPEPSSFLLLAFGTVAFLGRRSRY